jgi:hypothetical protein
MMVVEQDECMFRIMQPANLCLLQMIGPLATRWLGGYVAHAYKYTRGMEMDEYDEADDELHPEDSPLIALDLDTTSLGPLIAYMA